MVTIYLTTGLDEAISDETKVGILVSSYEYKFDKISFPLKVTLNSLFPT